MARGKTIGALSEAVKTAFQIIALKDGWKNYNDLLNRMIILYEKYNKQYEEEIKGSE